MADGIFVDRGNPDFVNEKGVKWWRDKLLTEHATRADSFGTALPDHVAWLIEEPNGRRTYLLTADGDVLAESQQLETIACKIDIIKLLKRGPS